MALTICHEEKRWLGRHISGSENLGDRVASAWIATLTWTRPHSPPFDQTILKSVYLKVLDMWKLFSETCIYWEIRVVLSLIFSFNSWLGPWRIIKGVKVWAYLEFSFTFCCLFECMVVMSCCSLLLFLTSSRSCYHWLRNVMQPRSGWVTSCKPRSGSVTSCNLDLGEWRHCQTF